MWPRAVPPGPTSREVVPQQQPPPCTHLPLHRGDDTVGAPCYLGSAVAFLSLMLRDPGRASISKRQRALCQLGRGPPALRPLLPPLLGGRAPSPLPASESRGKFPSPSFFLGPGGGTSHLFFLPPSLLPGRHLQEAGATQEIQGFQESLLTQESSLG